MVVIVERIVYLTWLCGVWFADVLVTTVRTQVRAYLDAPSLLKLEPEESIVKVNTALATIDLCFEHYQNMRSTINEEAKQPAEEGKAAVVSWDFDDTMCFHRIRAYRERIVLIQTYVLSVTDFLKLEKVETGIERWNVQIKSMLEQFVGKRDEIGKLSEEKFDCLDPKNAGFPIAYEAFKGVVHDYDRRLTTMALATFDEAGNLEAVCKLIIAFQGLLDRPTIAEVFDKKYYDLLGLFDAELDRLKVMLDTEKQAAHIAKNMPETAGTLLVRILPGTDGPRMLFGRCSVVTHECECMCVCVGVDHSRAARSRTAATHVL